MLDELKMADIKKIFRLKKTKTLVCNNQQFAEACSSERERLRSAAAVNLIIYMISCNYFSVLNLVKRPYFLIHRPNP